MANEDVTNFHLHRRFHLAHAWPGSSALFHELPADHRIGGSALQDHTSQRPQGCGAGRHPLVWPPPPDSHHGLRRRRDRDGGRGRMEGVTAMAIVAVFSLVLSSPDWTVAYRGPVVNIIILVLVLVAPRLDL